MPPTDTEPIVSPWYALRRQTNFVRCGWPRCAHCWKAIFSATSTAVDPESE